eukprot:m.636735 g.636735  ORF g.636735 m.636735 type:complete len:163 (-) comp22599_c0_seq5:3203-3691(-)
MNMPQGLVPPPLDPMFGKGGIFDGYNEDLVQICGVIILLAMLDLTFVPWLFSAKSRYFALHTVANAIATVASFPDVWRGLTDVETSWEGPSHTMMANSAICAIHIYHCIAFKLSVADIVHHLVFGTIAHSSAHCICTTMNYVRYAARCTSIRRKVHKKLVRM